MLPVNLSAGQLLGIKLLQHRRPSVWVLELLAVHAKRYLSPTCAACGCVLHGQMKQRPKTRMTEDIEDAVAGAWTAAKHAAEQERQKSMDVHRRSQGVWLVQPSNAAKGSGFGSNSAYGCHAVPLCHCWANPPIETRGYCEAPFSWEDL